jgi:hypothetical protein
MSKVQAVLFDKKLFSPLLGELWCRAHYLHPIKAVHITANKLRFRIRSPQQFNRFTTLTVANGIEFVLGWP